MGKVDLTKFCFKGENPFKIQEPFSKGKWTYATNGHMAIRVPRLHVPEFPENEKAPDVEELFKEADKRGPYEWVPVPEVKIETVQCGACKGIDIRKEDGEAFPCKRCNGEGHYQKAEPVKFPLGAATIALSNVYLDLIHRELPNPQIGLIKEAAGDHWTAKPVKIRFDGGEGLLMPIQI